MPEQYIPLRIGDVSPKGPIEKSKLEQMLKDKLPKDRRVRVNGMPTKPVNGEDMDCCLLYEQGDPNRFLLVKSFDTYQLALLAAASQRGEPVTVWGKLGVEKSDDEMGVNAGFCVLEADIVSYGNYKIMRI